MFALHAIWFSRWRSCWLNAGVFVAVVVGLILLAADCGGGATPGATQTNRPAGTTSSGAQGTPTTAATLSVSATPSAIGYAECMRANGVPDFPDPNSQGGLSFQDGPGSHLDPSSPQFQAAQEACRSLQPNHGVPDPTKAAQALQQALQYSACMRANGVPDFPDPSTTGGGIHISIQAQPGSDLTPNSPQFQAAQQTCESLMPGRGGTMAQSGGPKTGSGTSGSGP